MFETDWSKSSDRNIQLLKDPVSILTVAVVKDKQRINEIEDARVYDGSSRIRRPNVGQLAVLKNANGFFAAIKIISIRDDTRGSQFDELTFDYVIQTNGNAELYRDNVIVNERSAPNDSGALLVAAPVAIRYKTCRFPQRLGSLRFP